MFQRNKKLKIELTEFKNLKNNDLISKEIEFLNSSKDKEISYYELITELKIKHKDEINELKESHRIDLKKEFDEGYVKGIEISKIEVKVTPIRKVKVEGSFIGKKEMLDIGFSYRLFSNGIPCLEPHEEIIESIHKKEINEENIKLIAAKIENAISKIPNTNLVLTESIGSFSKKLINKK